jgi:hypothetical protein
MKLKGVNTFEQHVEKIVLGAAAAAFLIVFAMQFLLQPNRVAVGKGPTLPPEQAFDPPAQLAQQLRGQIQSTTPALPDPPKLTLLEDFKASLKKDLAPRLRLASPLGPGQSVVGSGEIQGTAGTDKGSEAASGQYAIPVIPAPVAATAAAFVSTIDPTEAVDNPELRKFLPEKQPLDKAAVSVEATVDGTAIKAALLGANQADARPLPANWWRDNVEILGVEVERQEQGSDGQWGAASKIPALPGRQSLFTDLSAGMGGAELARVVDEARRNGRYYQRPPYYTIIAGPAWIEPADAKSPADQARAAKEIDQLRTALKRQDDDIVRFQENLAKENAPKPNERETGRPGGGGKIGGTPSPSAPDNKKPQDNGSKLQLERRLKLAQDERAKIVLQLQDKGARVDDAAGSMARGPQPTTPAAYVPLLETPGVKVWTHDLTVQRGKTYRYRIAAVLNNPAFGKGSAMPESQQAFGEQVVLKSEPSAWTEPVAVDQDTYFVVNSASEGDNIGGPHATTELYAFYYGYWRRATAPLEPGDPLQGEARLPETLKLFDLDKLSKGPGQPGSPVRDERPAPPGPGRMPGIKGGAPAPVAPGNGPFDATDGASPAPKMVAIAVDGFLLDIARVPGGADAPGHGGFQAYFRDASGGIQVRIPEQDRANELYRRVALSAKEGENQPEPRPSGVGPAAPPPNPAGVPPPPPGPPGKKKPVEEPSPGGGGGGGG